MPPGMNEPIRAVAGVVDVEFVCGAAAPAGAVPDLLLEVPHGATRTGHFERARERLRGDIDARLIDFFFVNTDVGAPELARAIAGQVVAAAPTRTAVLVRSLLPRTFVDCNRKLAVDAAPTGSAKGQLTPGLPPWIADARDQRLLLELHAQYQATATAAFAAVCGRGGHALMVHTYAPRSIDVAVDADIVAALRGAYAADRIDTWKLRAPVDLITTDPAGEDRSARAVAAIAERELRAAGVDVTRNGTYDLHPATLAHEFCTRYAGRCLCFEVRRDLLVPEFVPFRELLVDEGKVAAMAAPFARALVAQG